MFWARFPVESVVDGFYSNDSGLIRVYAYAVWLYFSVENVWFIAYPRIFDVASGGTQFPFLSVGGIRPEAKGTCQNMLLFSNAFISELRSRSTRAKDLYRVKARGAFYSSGPIFVNVFGIDFVKGDNSALICLGFLVIFSNDFYP